MTCGSRIREIGPAALEPIVALLDGLDLLGRKAALGVISALPASDVAGLLIERVEGCFSSDDFCVRTARFLTMASQHEQAVKAVAGRIAELKPGVRDVKKTKSDEKVLAKKCAKYL